MSTSVAGFAARLRQATAPDHSRSEGAGFLDRLLGDEVDLDAYHLLAVQHRAIYGALEGAVAQLEADPLVRALHDPALDRVAAIERDLDWLGRRAAGPAPLVPATRRYARRISELATTWPAGVVAHHYTRYLGDLSGGLHIGRSIDRHLAGGTDFYRFDGIASPRRFKDAYRAHLDDAPWDADEQRRVIEEVQHAYACNRWVLADLERHLAGESDASRG